MKIIFARSTGIIDDRNAPVEIFGIATSIGVEDGAFYIVTDYAQESAVHYLSALGFANYGFSSDREILYVYERHSATEPARTPAVETPQPAVRQPAEIANHITHEVVIMPAAVDEDDENDDNDDTAKPGEPSPPLEVVSINDEELLGRAKNIVSPGCGSNITLYLQKLNEFNRIWGNAIVLKRQIDNLGKIFDSDEIVKSIKSDIEYLSTKCPIVDSVCLSKTGSSLVITTKEIVTAHQIDYGSRKIGRLQIIIGLCVYSNNISTADIGRAVEIRNIDRNPYYDSVYWVCGHVNKDTTNDPHSNICYGGYFQQVFDAIVSKNICQLFDIIIRFVQNPDEDDAWGSCVRFFPREVRATNEA